MGSAKLLIKQETDNNLIMIKLFDELKRMRYDNDAAIKAIAVIILTRQKLNGSFQKFPKKIRRLVKAFAKGKSFHMVWKNIDDRRSKCSCVKGIELTGDNCWKIFYIENGAIKESNIEIDGIIEISIN